MTTTEDTYLQPAHGWTCFHCGETFTTPGSARDHFGETPDKVPGCKIKLGEERRLLMELRKVEAERDSLLAVADTVIAAAYKRDHEKAVQACRNASAYTPEIQAGESPANIIQMLAVLLGEARTALEERTAEASALIDAATGLVRRYGPDSAAHAMYTDLVVSEATPSTALASALAALPIQTLPAKMVIAGYQMLPRPTVIYPADYKPTDTNNFRTLYALDNGKTTTESDELVAVPGMADSLESLAHGLSASGIASRTDARLVQQAAEAFRIFDMRTHGPITYGNSSAAPSTSAPGDLAAAACEHVACPICGEENLRQAKAVDGGCYITCLNTDCASNGGTNIYALQWHHPELARALDSRWDAATVMSYLISDATARQRTGVENVEDTLNALLRLEAGIKEKFGVELFAAPSRHTGAPA